MVKNPSTKAKTESVDEVILRLLGLKPGVEIDYQTYHDIIKKKLALGRLSGKELPREEDELLRNEFKRVRSLKEKGIRFKVKKAKVKKSKATPQNLNLNLNQKQLPAGGSAIVKYKKQAITPKDLIPKKVEEESEKGEKKKDNFSPLKKALDSILKTLGSKFKFDQKQEDQNRREKEIERRGKREASLEGLKKGIAGVVALTKKMLAPFDSILQRIWRFIFFTLLGRAFTKFMDWMSDKGNQEKFNSFIEFLSDHWPALAGLYILFGTGFGKLVRGLMKSAARMVVALAMSIPKLIGFIKKNKKLSFLALAAAPLVTREVSNLFKDKETPESTLIPKTNSELDEAKKLTDKSKDTKVPTLNVGGIVPQVKSQESGDNQKLKPQKIQGLNLGGLIEKFIGGGITPFGGMDFQSGVPISGAGKDDTLIAAKTGEAILTEKDQLDINRRYVDKTTGQPLNIPQYLSGRKPGYVNASNIKVRGLGGGFSEGGLIEKFNQGGVVGTNSVIGATPPIQMSGGGFLSSVGGSIRQFFGGKPKPKPKGLSIKGVRAGFTGMNKAGFEAISGGDKFRVATNPSFIGRGSRPVLGSGAYSAPTVRGAKRYVKPGGGVIRTIVPGSAIRSSLVDIVEPQQRVAPSTFDKGKTLADKILSNKPISQSGGRAGQSALRTRLQQQLLSGSSTNVMTGLSGLGRGSAALRVLGGLGKGALGILNRVPMLSDMLFPEATSSYDQLTGPNAYYNAPGYMGAKPQRRQGGGLIQTLGRFLPGTGTAMAPRSGGPKDIRGVRQTQAGYQNRFLGMPVGNVFYPRGRIGEYSQQENRRYYERTGKYFIPTDFGPGYEPGIHGLYTPYTSKKWYTSRPQSIRSRSTGLADNLSAQSQMKANIVNQILGRDSASTMTWGQGYRQLGNQYGWSTRGEQMKILQRRGLLKRQSGGIIPSMKLPGYQSGGRISKEEELARNAQAVTVMIEGSGPSGSGVLVRNDKGNYNVLTAGHVLQSLPGEEYVIVTPDGKRHVVPASNAQKFGDEVDMGMLKFSSKENYQVATPGDLSKMGENDQVFVGGFPLPTETMPESMMRFTKGNRITTDKNALSSGYNLTYNNPTFPGMSGGPVFNSRGELVAIHGRKAENKNTSQIESGSQAMSLSHYTSMFGDQSFGSTETNRPITKTPISSAPMSPNLLRREDLEVGRNIGFERGLNATLSGLGENIYNQNNSYVLGSPEQMKKFNVINKQGGGVVKENTGVNIPGATADRQLTALQPGEYVLPVDTVNRLGLSFVEKLVASTDSNSNAYLKKGKINRPEITPYSNKKSAITSMTLPPIDMATAGSKARSSGYSGGSSAPSFSAVSPINDRDKNAKMYYGIV